MFTDLGILFQITIMNATMSATGLYCCIAFDDNGNEVASLDTSEEFQFCSEFFLTILIEYVRYSVNFTEKSWPISRLYLLVIQITKATS